MKTITQIYLAQQLNVSPAYINYLVNGVKRPNWKRAKQLSKITGTLPELWLEGSPEDIKKIFNQNRKAEHDTGEQSNG